MKYFMQNNTIALCKITAMKLFNQLSKPARKLSIIIIKAIDNIPPRRVPNIGTVMNSSTNFTTAKVIAPPKKLPPRNFTIIPKIKALIAIIKMSIISTELKAKLFPTNEIDLKVNSNI